MSSDSTEGSRAQSQGGGSKPLEAFLLGRDMVVEYVTDADETINIEDVRKALAKIEGKLSDTIREERDAT